MIKTAQILNATVELHDIARQMEFCVYLFYGNDIGVEEAEKLMKSLVGSDEHERFFKMTSRHRLFLKQFENLHKQFMIVNALLQLLLKEEKTL